MKQIFKKNRLFIAIYLFPFCFMMFLLCDRTNYSITLPGNISPIETSIVVDGAKDLSGSINSIYVISFSHSTRFQNFLVNQSKKINDIHEINENDSSFSDYENYLMGQIQKNQSNEASIITAYLEASQSSSKIKLVYEFQGYIVHYYTKENTTFQLGDIIVGVNGIQAKDDRILFEEILFNKDIERTCQVLRNDELIDIQVQTGGIYLYEKYIVDGNNSVPQFSFKADGTGGPSGGLLQTIYVYNNLIDEDLTQGKIISGTGTINVDGSVGAIGGIKQKIYTALYNDVDVFFCPEANYEEALKTYNDTQIPNDMHLVCVKTFSDAINYLRGI